MATKRSFSEKVVGSDAFAELSFEAQALYLQLCMAADDEGFVSSPKRIQSSIGAASDTLSALEEAGFLITFDSGVCVIVHFCQSNHISEKRKKATEHANELAELYLDEDGVYHKKEKCEEKAAAEVPAYKLHANCIQTASNLQAKPLPPSFLPPSSPSLPSPTPLSFKNFQT